MSTLATDPANQPLAPDQLRQVYGPALVNLRAAVKKAEIDLVLAETNVTACRGQLEAVEAAFAADLGLEADHAG